MTYLKKRRVFLTITFFLITLCIFSLFYREKIKLLFIPIQSQKIAVDKEVLIKIPKKILINEGRYTFLFTSAPEKGPNLLKRWISKNEIALFDDIPKEKVSPFCEQENTKKGTAQISFESIFKNYQVQKSFNNCQAKKYEILVHKVASDLEVSVFIKPLNLKSNTVYLTVVNNRPSAAFQVKIILYTYIFPFLSILLLIINLMFGKKIFDKKLTV